LLHYLQSIRQSYLSTATSSVTTSNTTHKQHHHHQGPRPGPGAGAGAFQKQQHPNPKGAIQTQNLNLTDQDRDSIDSSTALLLRDLSTSVSNLAAAEQLRQDTEARLLLKKYGKSQGSHLKGVLMRWAAGGGDGDSAYGRRNEYRTAEQEQEEEGAKAIRAVRESILWYLRRELESAAEVQRAMVEKRIERAREKEKSVLYKIRGNMDASLPPALMSGESSGSTGFAFTGHERINGTATGTVRPNRPVSDPVSTITAEEIADIESQLSPEQLQLFAQENDFMLKQYEDMLGKVQYVYESPFLVFSLSPTLAVDTSTFFFFETSLKNFYFISFFY